MLIFSVVKVLWLNKLLIVFLSVKVDWLNRFIEIMWPYLDKVRSSDISCCIFLKSFVLSIDRPFFSLILHLLIPGNLQDCKDYSEAHYCWTNSKIQNWICWFWSTYLGFSTTYFSRFSLFQTPFTSTEAHTQINHLASN